MADFISFIKDAIRENPQVGMAYADATLQQSIFETFCVSIGWECKSMYAADLTIVEGVAEPSKFVDTIMYVIGKFFKDIEGDTYMKRGKRFSSLGEMVTELCLVFSFKRTYYEEKGLEGFAMLYKINYDGLRKEFISQAPKRDRDFLQKWITD